MSQNDLNAVSSFGPLHLMTDVFDHAYLGPRVVLVLNDRRWHIDLWCMLDKIRQGHVELSASIELLRLKATAHATVVNLIEIRFWRTITAYTSNL
ncbi:MAG: hypothetical protein AB3N19_04435 [Ruegeria sp.]